MEYETEERLPVTGKVIEEHKNYFLVSTQDGPVRSTLRGAFKRKKVAVCTGDQVEVEIINRDSSEGLIRNVAKRINFLPRPSLANIDRIFLINSFKSPLLDLYSTDRFLFMTAVYEIETVIVFNKSDLLNKEESERLGTILSFYEQAGYSSLCTSAIQRSGIDKLLGCCRGKSTVFAGKSGGGKSTLLSVIFPDHTFKIGALSDTCNRGRHTTTYTALIPLDDSSYIADTPGFSFVEIPKIPGKSAAYFFPEIRAETGNCRFNNCRHAEEPGCTVRTLVSEGKIAPWRHKHYLAIRKELEQAEKQYR